MVDKWLTYRINSRGWQTDSPAKVHTSIIFGAGFTLTPQFALKNNITHVVNCAYDQDSPAWFRTVHPDKYVCLNANDALDQNILDWYPAFEDSMNRFFQDPECKTIYVHCQCGINRSGFLTVLYIVRKFGYEYDTVVRSILRQRPCALTNTSFEKQVINCIRNNGRLG